MHSLEMSPGEAGSSAGPCFSMKGTQEEPRKTYEQSGRQALAALGTTSPNDGSSTAGRHAGPETMPACALEEAWLKCTLHFLDPFRD